MGEVRCFERWWSSDVGICRRYCSFGWGPVVFALSSLIARYPMRNRLQYLSLNCLRVAFCNCIKYSIVVFRFNLLACLYIIAPCGGHSPLLMVSSLQRRKVSVVSINFVFLIFHS